MITQLPFDRASIRSPMWRKNIENQENIINITIRNRISDIYKKLLHVEENNEKVIFSNIYF